jgi:hypothetical protein
VHSTREFSDEIRKVILEVAASKKANTLSRSI